MHTKLKSKLALAVRNSVIKPSSSAKNFGVIFHKHINMESQVVIITDNCGSANFHRSNIGAIRPVLTDTSAPQLVHSFIISQLDYFVLYSLLTGLQDVQIKILQYI